MKKRVIITTIVAFVLFAASVAAGLNAIFTVTHVRADFTTYSEAGREEAAELREKLDAFVGKSSAFLDLDDVKETVESYPCFRLVSIKKQYPTTVRLEVAERRETFALPYGDGGYAIIDEEGRYLYDSAENANRADGENILLEGFALSPVNGKMEGEYFSELLAVSDVFRGALTEIRANVLSVGLVRPVSNKRSDFFRIRMREGVIIDIANPSVSADGKAALALDVYQKLGDEARTFGFITVMDNAATGELLSDYSRNSGLI